VQYSVDIEQAAWQLVESDYSEVNMTDGKNTLTQCLQQNNRRAPVGQATYRLHCAKTHLLWSTGRVADALASRLYCLIGSGKL